jgi:hypothetical protein
LSSKRLKEAKGLPISAPPVGEGVGKVRVVYGVHALSVGVAGRTVGDVRVVLGQAMNISPRAIALVNGQEVNEGQILLPGQHLEFVRQAGEKGDHRRSLYRTIAPWAM